MLLALKKPVDIDIQLRINYIGTNGQPAATHTQEIVDQARKLAAQGQFDEAISLLQNTITNSPSSQIIEGPLKDEMRDLYFNEAQITFRKDPHSKEALELAKRRWQMIPLRLSPKS